MMSNFLLCLMYLLGLVYFSSFLKFKKAYDPISCNNNDLASETLLCEMSNVQIKVLGCLSFS